jgi:hypothetical protein
MATAFQPNAFQNNAFQIVLAPSGTVLTGVFIDAVKGHAFRTKIKSQNGVVRFEDPVIPGEN